VLLIVVADLNALATLNIDEVFALPGIPQGPAKP